MKKPKLLATSLLFAFLVFLFLAACNNKEQDVSVIEDESQFIKIDSGPSVNNRRGIYVFTDTNGMQYLIYMNSDGVAITPRNTPSGLQERSYK